MRYYASRTRSASPQRILLPQRALLFPVPVTFLLGVALVMVLLAARERDLDLDTIVLPVHRGRHDRVTLALDRADQLVDFLFVQQQLARAPIIGNDMGRRRQQRRNRRPEQVDLAVLDDRVGVAEVDPSGAQALD